MLAELANRTVEVLVRVVHVGDAVFAAVVVHELAEAFGAGVGYASWIEVAFGDEHGDDESSIDIVLQAPSKESVGDFVGLVGSKLLVMVLDEGGVASDDGGVGLDSALGGSDHATAG